MNKLIFIFVLSFSFTFGQNKNNTKIEVLDVPFAIIDKSPIYPGCNTQDDTAIKKCTSERISTFVSSNFNMKIKDSLGLPPNKYLFSVKFKIDTLGNVEDIRTRAPDPIIEEEAIRVISSLPKFTPGEQKGKPVGTLYAIPVQFEVAPKND